MTPAEFIAFATQRHGPEWKSRLADETGYSWWTLRRIEKGGKVSKRVERKVRELEGKNAVRARTAAVKATVPPTDSLFERIATILEKKVERLRNSNNDNDYVISRSPTHVAEAIRNVAE